MENFNHDEELERRYHPENFEKFREYDFEYKPEPLEE